MQHSPMSSAVHTSQSPHDLRQAPRLNASPRMYCSKGRGQGRAYGDELELDGSRGQPWPCAVPQRPPLRRACGFLSHSPACAHSAQAAAESSQSSGSTSFSTSSVPISAGRKGSVWIHLVAARGGGGGVSGGGASLCTHGAEAQRMLIASTNINLLAAAASTLPWLPCSRTRPLDAADHGAPCVQGGGVLLAVGVQREEEQSVALLGLGCGR